MHNIKQKKEKTGKVRKTARALHILPFIEENIYVRNENMKQEIETNEFAASILIMMVQRNLDITHFILSYDLH